MGRALLPLAAALALALAVAGCGGDAGEDAAPATTAVATQATRSIDLAAIALRLSDLPRGATAREEGYVQTTNAVASYRRNFDPSDVRIGGSQLVDLECNVALFPDEDLADVALQVIRGAFSNRRTAPAFLKTILLVTTGFEPANVRGQTLSAARLGEGSVIAGASFDTPAGRADGVFIFVRIGRLHGALFLIGPEGRVDVADAGPLVQTMMDRMTLAADEPTA